MPDLRGGPAAGQRAEGQVRHPVEALPGVAVLLPARQPLLQRPRRHPRAGPSARSARESILHADCGWSFQAAER